jgi:chromosome segregation ATPase
MDFTFHFIKPNNMETLLYLSSVAFLIIIGVYIIFRLFRDNEQLIVELHEAKAEVRTLGVDLYEARRSNGKANAYIEQLNNQLIVMGKKLPEYNNEAKRWKFKLNALDAEHRKTIQQLYGRIGAMQKQINRLKQYC